MTGRGNNGDVKPLFIVFNIGSGHGDAALARATIENACAEAGRRCFVMLVDAPGRLAQVAHQAVRGAQQAGGIVVAAGGDGTISAVAQVVLGSGVPFGVLPQGTFNYFSRTHGIPADIAQAMQVLLHESPQAVQVGLVNQRVFLVNASLGLYPKLLEDRETWKKQFGRHRLVAFGAGLLTLLRGHRNLRLRVELDNSTRELRTPTLFIGNNALQMEQLGFPEAQAIDSGRLAGVMLHPVGRLAMLWLLLRGALGQLGDADKVRNFSFKQLTVSRSRAWGMQHIKVGIDGEVSRLRLPLRFSVSPQPLLLIRPAAPAPERAET
ncbi:diacylglycerol kinase family enzyme [Roseateles toxinivorans]|uniref:Diacylglycerol kinase family enzyme n=1 Tax=Roseateles toxinivorans TaxID=270368 RepID=A0A4R6QMP4_9BURK|nr:diacylglycerol kinase family enzyme [Roseateles toxinivorans]